MKIRQKSKIRITEMLRIKKSFKYQPVLALFFVAFFVFSGDVFADCGGVVINEIQISGGLGKTTEDFIELYNKSNLAVDISDWKLRKKTSSGGAYASVKVFKDNSIIPANGYFLWANTIIKDALKSDEASSAIISSDNSIALLDSKDSIIDQVGWGKSLGAPFVEIIAVDIAKFIKGLPEIIQRKSFQDTDNNNDDFEIVMNSSPTSSGCLEEPEKCKIEEEKEITPAIVLRAYPTAISITELFPNPFQSQYEEYVELYNGSAEDVDLLGWTLHDASKAGKYTFAQGVILKAQKFLAVFKKDFKFALNNSGDESVMLFDPNGKEVSKASYDGSKRNVSYNFDGSRWRWSKFLTPGAENILNNEPFGTLKIDKNIFKNAYANFSVSTGDADGDKVKVTWDFGDGHKSYLAKTRHKYEEVGTYNASVKFSDGSEDVVKTFIAEVRKFPHPKVRIISVNANPVGSDTLGESLTIENKSKEKINLEGWSIATGSKTLANHPITEKFILKKKESKEITREISKFTLNNKKGKIELRYPDGEVADKVKYEKRDGIEEGEVYTKSNKQWVWIATSQKSIRSIKQEEIVDASLVISNQSLDTNAVNVEEKVAGAEMVKKEYSFVMFENDIVIGKMEFKNSDARVLGVEIVREVDGQYFLTPIAKEKQHYAITFFNDVFLVINSKLNTLLNFF